MGTASALDYSKGTQVAKVGRSTGFVVAALETSTLDDATVYVSGLGNVRFDDVIEIAWESPDKPFSDSGDSGSLVFAVDDMHAIGLVFAGGILRNMETGQEFGVTYACSLGNALDALKAKMLI